MLTMGLFGVSIPVQNAAKQFLANIAPKNLLKGRTYKPVAELFSNKSMKFIPVNGKVVRVSRHESFTDEALKWII